MNNDLYIQHNMSEPYQVEGEQLHEDPLLMNQTARLKQLRRNNQMDSRQAEMNLKRVLREQSTEG